MAAGLTNSLVPACTQYYSQLIKSKKHDNTFCFCCWRRQILLYIINIKAGVCCIRLGSPEPVIEFDMQVMRAMKKKEKADLDRRGRKLTVMQTNKISASSQEDLEYI